MSSRRPQDLLFTLYGEYFAHREQPVWVGSLISLLRPFRVSEGAVRTVLSRMSRKRWLLARRSGRNAYYALSNRGRRVVDEGGERIFHPPDREAWDGRWCLVTYSIPEDVRHLRDRLRVRLAWLGFGSLGNGVWLSPHDVHERLATLAEEMGLAGNLVCFGAEQLDGGSAEALVGRCWDLSRVAGMYRDFLHRWCPVLRDTRRSLAAGTTEDEEAFVLRFKLIHEYRSFPLEDPFLPRVLLPDDWPEPEANALFLDLHDLLEEPSNRYVEAILSREPEFKGRHRPVTA